MLQGWGNQGYLDSTCHALNAISLNLVKFRLELILANDNLHVFRGFKDLIEFNV